ncbi:MAG: hypothetical protein EXQ86_11575 [Rhodospirillales bacterium]|nr:hypothetical protein [Rhodospirillales bacterium]
MTPQFLNAGSIELAQAQADSIGRIDGVSGPVFITRVDGARVQASQGTQLFQGDSVETGPGAKLGILFADDSTFAMGEKGKMALDEMVYDPGSQTGKAAIAVAEGLFSFVSGQIAKTAVDAMVITTPVATIGVRGTAGAGKAGPEGTTNTFALLPDPGTGAVGEMTMRTAVGTQILNQPFQATQVVSAFVPPPPPVILPPSVINKAFGAVTASLPAPTTVPTAPTAAQAAPALAPAAPTGTTVAAAAAGAQGGGKLGSQGASTATADQAFDAALAGAGGSIEKAIAAAQDVVTVTAARAGFAGPTDTFTPAAVITNVMNSVLGQSMGSLGQGFGQKDPLSGGTGTDSVVKEASEDVKELIKAVIQQAIKDANKQAANVGVEGNLDTGEFDRTIGTGPKGEIDPFALFQFVEDLLDPTGALFAAGQGFGDFGQNFGDYADIYSLVPDSRPNAFGQFGAGFGFGKGALAFAADFDFRPDFNSSFAATFDFGGDFDFARDVGIGFDFGAGFGFEPGFHFGKIFGPPLDFERPPGNIFQEGRGATTGGVTISDNATDTIGRTLVGSTGADKLFGAGGGDIYRLGSDSAADAVYYKNATDGAAAGAVSAYDSINDFVSGTDKIKFVTQSTTLSTFDDVTINNTAKVASAATNGANLSTAEVVRITNTVANADLTTLGFANVIAAIGTVTAGTATAADAQNDAIFIVNGSTKAGIYLYTNADGGTGSNTTVESGELTLLGVVENTQITNNNDIEFTSAVHT